MSVDGEKEKAAVAEKQKSVAQKIKSIDEQRKGNTIVNVAFFLYVCVYTHIYV